MGIIRLDYSLVTVRVVYFLPDYHDILQEFLWQTMDLRPRYPRVQRFLDHWRREIDAVIKEIDICELNTEHHWRHGIVLPS
jgi:uncharacterized protein Usg